MEEDLCRAYSKYHHGIIHFEFLTLNTAFNFQQLQHVLKNLRKYPALVGRRNIVLFHDNARPHSARISLFGWSVLHHSPYSPDFVSSNFHFFHSVQNALDDKTFSQEHQVKMFLEKLSLKVAEFYLRGINNLPDKWQDVIQNNGKYTIAWN